MISRELLVNENELRHAIDLDSTLENWAHVINVIHSFTRDFMLYTSLINEGQFNRNLIFGWSHEKPEEIIVNVSNLSYNGIEKGIVLSVEINPAIEQSYAMKETIKKHRRDRVFHIYLDYLIPNFDISFDYFISEEDGQAPNSVKVRFENLETNIILTLKEIDTEFVGSCFSMDKLCYFQKPIIDLEYEMDGYKILTTIKRSETEKRAKGLELLMVEIERVRNHESSMLSWIQVLLRDIEEYLAPKICIMESMIDIWNSLRKIFLNTSEFDDDVTTTSKLEEEQLIQNFLKQNMVSYILDKISSIREDFNQNGKNIEEMLNNINNSDPKVANENLAYIDERFLEEIERNRFKNEIISFDQVILKTNQINPNCKKKVDKKIKVDKFYPEMTPDSFKFRAALTNEEEQELNRLKNSFREWVTLTNIIHTFDANINAFNQQLKPYWDGKILKTEEINVEICPPGIDQSTQLLFQACKKLDQAFRTFFSAQVYFKNIKYKGLRTSDVYESEINLSFQESNEPLPLPNRKITKKRSDKVYQLVLKVKIPLIEIEADFYVKNESDSPTVYGNMKPGSVKFEIKEIDLSTEMILKEIDKNFVINNHSNYGYYFQAPQISVKYSAKSFKMNVKQQPCLVTSNSESCSPHPLANNIMTTFIWDLENRKDDVVGQLNPFINEKLKLMMRMPSIFEIPKVIKQLWENDPDKPFQFYDEEETKKVEHFFYNINKTYSYYKYINKELRGVRKYLSFRDKKILKIIKTEYNSRQSLDGLLEIITNMET